VEKVEGLVNGWWVGGEGGLSVGRIGGKGGRAKEVAVIEVPLPLFSLLWWALCEQSLCGGVGCIEAELLLCA
jgi:hypothetical protein